jgi:hypothetical protein
MRLMAALTARGTAGRVLEDERTLMVFMALTANKLGTPPLHLPQREGAVGLMTLGTLHEAFANRMMERHQKARSLIGVTFIAKRRFRLGHDLFGGAHGMKLLRPFADVTIVASHALFVMVAAVKI